MDACIRYTCTGTRTRAASVIRTSIFISRNVSRAGVLGDNVQSVAQTRKTRHQREIAILVAALGANQRNEAALVARGPRVQIRDLSQYGRHGAQRIALVVVPTVGMLQLQRRNHAA